MDLNIFCNELHKAYMLISTASGANVHATTATGDTALTYACENGHTDVADVLLQAGADLVSHYLLKKNIIKKSSYERQLNFFCSCVHC